MGGRGVWRGVLMGGGAFLDRVGGRGYYRGVFWGFYGGFYGCG